MTLMKSQDRTVGAQPDGSTTVKYDLSDSAPAASTLIPQDGLSGEATEGRTAVAFDMTA